MSQIFENIWEVLQDILRTSVQFGTISIEKYVSKGITHPVFYGDLICKLRRIKGTAKDE